MSDSISKRSANIEPLYLANSTISAEPSTSQSVKNDTIEAVAGTTIAVTTNEPSNSRSVDNQKSIDVRCLLCDETYQFYQAKDDYLAHLFLKHRLVIADEEQVAIFDEYLLFWREKFNGDPNKLPEYCTTMHLDHLPDGTPSKNEKYYLLADILPEDNELRRRLHVKRLETVLAQHQFERTDTTFELGCLYCREIIKSTRANYIEHLFSKHFLQLGKSENLVYVDELIQVVHTKMTNLICLFCEKKFKDRPTLKEHMRKKGHKRINPDNKSYDRFYLVNYKGEKRTQNQRTKHMEYSNARTNGVARTAQNQREQQRPKASAVTSYQRNRIQNLDIDSDSDWSDWEGEKQVLTCLFCPLDDTDYINLKLHMKNEHRIDFDHITGKLSFYDRVKIVNFIRRQMHSMKCVTCGDQYTTTGELQRHLQQNNHYGIGERVQWDLPEYFIPTYEDDAFLYFLDDTYDTDDINDDNADKKTSNHQTNSDVVSEDDWSDWEGERQALTCLYCSVKDIDFGNLKLHIKSEHNMDFDDLTKQLSFYDRVKIVNFVRRQMHMLKCVTCCNQFKTIDDLQQHLRAEMHCGIGERQQWDMAEYYFPTYEDDAFLFSMDEQADDDDDDGDGSYHLSRPFDTSVVVHSEDREFQRNVDAEALSKEQTEFWWNRNSC